MHGRTILFTLFLIVLAGSMFQEVYASPIEIAYDGTLHYNNWEVFAGVRFSLPAGVACAQLVTARFYWVYKGDPVTVHITASNRVTELTPPIPTTSSSDPPIIFTDLNVQGLNIVVTGDFYIVLEHTCSSCIGNFGSDNAANVGRSFWGTSLASLTLYPWGNILIRAVVEPITSCPAPAGAPVGGFVLPANTLALVAPWLAVIGVVGCIATVAVIVKKRRP